MEGELIRGTVKTSRSRFFQYFNFEGHIEFIAPRESRVIGNHHHLCPSLYLDPAAFPM